jgi:hypothetical protein
VVVGSALVEIVAAFKEQPERIPDQVAGLVRQLRSAIDAGDQPLSGATAGQAIPLP